MQIPTFRTVQELYYLRNLFCLDYIIVNIEQNVGGGDQNNHNRNEHMYKRMSEPPHDKTTKNKCTNVH